MRNRTFTIEGSTLLIDDATGLLILKDGKEQWAVSFSEAIGNDGEKRYYQMEEKEFFDKVKDIKINDKFFGLDIPPKTLPQGKKVTHAVFMQLRGKDMENLTSPQTIK
jgi:hypothetical protein